MSCIPESWVGCIRVQLQEGFNTGLDNQALDGIGSPITTGHILLSVLINRPSSIVQFKLNRQTQKTEAST